MSFRRGLHVWLVYYWRVRMNRFLMCFSAGCDGSSFSRRLTDFSPPCAALSIAICIARSESSIYIVGRRCVVRFICSLREGAQPRACRCAQKRLPKWIGLRVGLYAQTKEVGRQMWWTRLCILIVMLAFCFFHSIAVASERKRMSSSVYVWRHGIEIGFFFFEESWAHEL